MKTKNYSSFIIVIVFLTAIAFLVSQPSLNLQSENKPEDIKSVKIARQDVRVDLALTITEQERGLGGKSGIEENEGMLFIFPQSGNYSFWMKGMNFPIDIIWMSGEGRVVYIKKDARPASPELQRGEPESYLESYGPDPSLQNTKYVLEIASGFSDKNNLQVGDKVEFTY